MNRQDYNKAKKLLQGILKAKDAPKHIKHQAVEKLKGMKVMHDEFLKSEGQQRLKDIHKEVFGQTIS